MPCLGGRDPAERVEHLAQGHPGGQLGRGRPACAECRQCRRMDGGVLPDLERGEVEPERPELPAEVRDLAPGNTAEPIGGKRLLDLDELDIEVGRAGVPATAWTGLAGQGRSCPAEPFRDEPEALPVGFLREAAAELSIGLGQVLGVAGET